MSERTRDSNQLGPGREQKRKEREGKEEPLDANEERGLAFYYASPEQVGPQARAANPLLSNFLFSTMVIFSQDTFTRPGWRGETPAPASCVCHAGRGQPRRWERSGCQNHYTVKINLRPLGLGARCPAATVRQLCKIYNCEGARQYQRGTAVFGSSQQYFKEAR